jgi:hypothetical protein
MDSEIIAAFIGPVFTAMLAGGGILFKSIQVRHREQNARARDLEVATRTVDFINTYLQAQDKLQVEADREWFRERAKRDLEVAYQTMMATASADYRADSSTAWISVVKRALLFGLRRTAAKVVRVFFYIFTVLNVLFFGIWTATTFSDPELQRDIPVMIFVIIFGVIFFLVPIVLLYVWARWLDRDRTPTAAPVPVGADPLLGEYGYWQPVPEQPYGPPPGSGPYPPR